MRGIRATTRYGAGTAGTISACHRSHQRGTKVLCHAFALLIAGRRENPHHQEQRHERRHEIGQGDLPATAVVLAHHLLAPDDDRTFVSGHTTHPAVTPDLALRTYSSSSLKPGRSTLFSALRPNSTAN